VSRCKSVLAVAVVLVVAAQGAPGAQAFSAKMYAETLLPGATLGGIVRGHEGDIWFTSEGGRSGGAIGRIEPATGTVVWFREGLRAGARPGQIAVAPDGSLWFAVTGTRSAIGRIVPATGRIAEFAGGLSGSPVGIVAGPEGDMWFTEQGGEGKIGRITPRGAISEFPNGFNASFQPHQIAVGPEGNLWFTDAPPAAGLGRIDPATGIAQTVVYGGVAPVGVIGGAQGSVWISDDGFTRRLDRIEPEVPEPAGWATEPFPTGVPSGAVLGQLAMGSEGDVWFAEDLQPSLGRFDPISHTYEEFQTEAPAGFLATEPEGEIWFTSSLGLGRLAPAGAPAPARSGPVRIGSLRMTPSVIHSAGATVAYRDSEAQETTFVIERVLTGRNDPSPCPRAAHVRCTLLERVASFVHHDVAGPNRVRLSVQVNGRRLAPGSYRLQAWPGGSSDPALRVTANFRIARPKR
jgi:virginiamycin B lyase